MEISREKSEIPRDDDRDAGDQDAGVQPHARAPRRFFRDPAQHQQPGDGREQVMARGSAHVPAETDAAQQRYHGLLLRDVKPHRARPRGDQTLVGEQGDLGGDHQGGEGEGEAAGGKSRIFPGFPPVFPQARGDQEHRDQGEQGGGGVAEPGEAETEAGDHAADDPAAAAPRDAAREAAGGDHGHRGRPFVVARGPDPAQHHAGHHAGGEGRDPRTQPAAQHQPQREHLRDLQGDAQATGLQNGEMRGKDRGIQHIELAERILLLIAEGQVAQGEAIAGREVKSFIGEVEAVVGADEEQTGPGQQEQQRKHVAALEQPGNRRYSSGIIRHFRAVMLDRGSEAQSQWREAKLRHGRK